METVSAIVSILQEVFEMFPSIISGNMILFADLQGRLMEHIKREFPKLAQQHASKFTSFVTLNNEKDPLDIIAPLLDSPSKKCQQDGIDALLLYLEPFAMVHFEQYKAVEKGETENYEKFQKSRLDKAFRSCMLPYDRPTLTPGAKNQRDIGLSLCILVHCRHTKEASSNIILVAMQFKAEHLVTFSPSW